MIERAVKSDINALTELVLLLWPDHTREETHREIMKTMSWKDAAFYLAKDGERAVGFAQCQLRHDYVEGTESSPVGYLEGIYVAEEYRRQGFARRLLAACEAWAKEMDCSEFASDCELDNTQSLRFHQHMGFVEANRIICFTKEL